MFQVGTAVEDITPATAQYLGGFDQMAQPTAVAHDPLQVRAFAVAHGSTIVESAIVDTQGWFAGYQEGPFGVTDARQAAAAWLDAHGYPGTDEGHLIVSSTHSHAAPTIMGIWGPTDPDYLERVHDQTVLALQEAAQSLQPAQLWTADGDSSAIDGSNVEQTDIYDGYAVDGDTPVLWARQPRTGKTVGLYVNIPVHADVVNGAAEGDHGEMSADHIGVTRNRLGDVLGGTAVVAMGTLGRQESIVQVGGYDYSQDVGRTTTNEVLSALRHAKPVTDATLAAAEQYVAVPVTNPALGALVCANLLTGYVNTPPGRDDRPLGDPAVRGRQRGRHVGHGLPDRLAALRLRARRGLPGHLPGRP